MRVQERKDQRQRSSPEITLVTEISASHPATPTACPATPGPAPPGQPPQYLGGCSPRKQSREASSRGRLPAKLSTATTHSLPPPQLYVHRCAAGPQAKGGSSSPAAGRLVPRNPAPAWSWDRPLSAPCRPRRAPRTRAGTGTQRGCSHGSKDSPAPDCPGLGKHHSADTRRKRGTVRTRVDPKTRMTFQSEKSRRQVCVPAV